MDIPLHVTEDSSGTRCQIRVAGQQCVSQRICSYELTVQSLSFVPNLFTHIDGNTFKHLIE
jgi:hypothetical protein